MVQEKTKRTDLSVADWVGKEWRKGTRQKEEMAQVLQDVNWDKDRGIWGNGANVFFGNSLN